MTRASNVVRVSDMVQQLTKTPGVTCVMSSVTAGSRDDELEFVENLFAMEAHSFKFTDKLH